MKRKQQEGQEKTVVNDKLEKGEDSRETAGHTTEGTTVCSETSSAESEECIK